MTTQVGAHQSISNGIITAIERTLDQGGSALQIFLSPNRGASPGKPIDSSTGKDVKEILTNTGIYLVIHGKYILNFCSPNPLWYRDALVADLKKANQLGDSVGVVIHQGKNKPDFKQNRQQAIKTYVNHLEQVLETTSDLPNPIILENSCQQGNEIGYTLDELAEIYQSFQPKYQSRIKFCLDTCHIFVAGTLRFESKQEVDQFFQKFDQMIGINKLEVIHLNDSKTPFDGHNDHHHDIGKGYILSSSYTSPVKRYQKFKSDQMRGSLEGFQRLLSWAKTYSIPLILETPQEDSVSYQEQIEQVNQWLEEVPSVKT